MVCIAGPCIRKVGGPDRAQIYSGFGLVSTRFLANYIYIITSGVLTGSAIDAIAIAIASLPKIVTSWPDLISSWWMNL